METAKSWAVRILDASIKELSELVAMPKLPMKVAADIILVIVDRRERRRKEIQNSS